MDFRVIRRQLGQLFIKGLSLVQIPMIEDGPGKMAEKIVVVGKRVKSMPENFHPLSHFSFVKTGYGGGENLVVFGEFWGRSCLVGC
jgi:hypothetical protein